MKISILKVDITNLKCEAIVNAANTSLLGGSGVDGVIHRKGGKRILEACRAIVAKQGKCNVGEAVITTAGNLQAKFVIHTGGPVWNVGGVEKEFLLKKCYENSLNLAYENNVKSIAFPNISTGIYKFPKNKAAKIAIQSICDFKKKSTIDEVIFACFDHENFEIYNELITQFTVV